MKHLGTKNLETERLRLRPFIIDDAETMLRNWAGDGEVTKFLTWPTHTDSSVSRSVLEHWVAAYESADAYQWAIILKELNEPIGSIGAVGRDDEIEMVHIGYCIGRPWWHRGIMSEAFSRVIKYFFEEVGVNRIESRHAALNPNSGAVMRKCGLIYEGTKRQGDCSNYGIGDSVEYAILARDYFTPSP
ncbi:MAG: N-acetyltransferase [Clostridia bacterium]|nr:N-acetyltransferase [Clostridia bacterium]